MRQPGDGSCLFHSLAHGLRQSGGRIENHRELRFALMDWLDRHQDAKIADTPVKDWVTWDSNCSVPDYTTKMRGYGWGGGIEMAAFARCFDVDVHVYERDAKHGEFPYKRISRFEARSPPSPAHARARTHGGPTHPQKRPVNVLYCGGVHYDALVAHREALVELGNAHDNAVAAPKRASYHAGASPRLDAHGPSLRPDHHRQPKTSCVHPPRRNDYHGAKPRTSYAPKPGFSTYGAYPAAHHTPFAKPKSTSAGSKYYGNQRHFPYKRSW